MSGYGENTSTQEFLFVVHQQIMQMLAVSSLSFLKLGLICFESLLRFLHFVNVADFVVFVSSEIQVLSLSCTVQFYPCQSVREIHCAQDLAIYY